jgi:hypothetical protein
MSAKKANRRRIEIDVAFAPMPQALILDHQVSAQACRLWGVLFVFRWNDLQPEFDKLAEALNTTARSVYRWLQELESTGWIGWDRNAGIPDRFTLHTTAVLPGNDTGVNSEPEELIPRSKQLIPRSKQLTPVSQELTQVSIPALLDPAPMAQTDTVSSDQKIQKIQNGVGDARTLAFLIDKGVSAAEEFAHIPYEIARADYEARHDDGQSRGHIVLAWRSAPPTKDYHYERSRPTLANASPDRPRRSERHSRRNPERDAEFAAELAELERMAK